MRFIAIAMVYLGLFALIGFVVWMTGNPEYLWALVLCWIVPDQILECKCKYKEEEKE